MNEICENAFFPDPKGDNNINKRNFLSELKNLSNNSSSLNDNEPRSSFKIEEIEVLNTNNKTSSLINPIVAIKKCKFYNISKKPY